MAVSHVAVGEGRATVLHVGGGGGGEGQSLRSCRFCRNGVIVAWPLKLVPLSAQVQPISDLLRDSRPASRKNKFG